LFFLGIICKEDFDMFLGISIPRNFAIDDYLASGEPLNLGNYTYSNVACFEPVVPKDPFP
jgi:hypothetical protein